MAFVRVTDPELAAQLYDAGLLYELNLSEELGWLPAEGWGPYTPWRVRIRYTSWQFGVYLEE